MSAVDDLDEAARAILKGNDRGGYTVPTAGLYPYQWNWDSAVAAQGFATFDLPRAWVELETLFSGQWADGMVPHILFHRVDPGYFPGPDVWGGVGPLPSSGITQPPIAASSAWQLFQAGPDLGRAPMERLFTGMRAWHRWFIDWRSDAQGAICVTHPWESGRDNTPEWDATMHRIDPVGVGEYTRRDTGHVDASMRPTKFDYDRYVWLVQQGRRLGWDQAKLAAECPFRVADPTTTFILLRAHRDLKEMGEALGLDTSGMEDEIAALEAGARSLWNEILGSFDGRDAITGDWCGAVTNASFLNWYGGIESQGQLAQLDRIMEAVRFPVPSYDPAGAHFDGMRYWRGPTWAFMNMLIGRGLADYAPDRAERLRQATADLIAEHGFAEYYDPRDGSPAGGKSFTWTAAVWLSWASPNAGRG